MIISDIKERGQKQDDLLIIKDGDCINAPRFNRLPSPVTARILGGMEHWIETLDVQTGCTRLDVSGRIDLSHFSDVLMLIDSDGVEHDPDVFWLD